MSDHDALLAAVLANPEDDLPRLVFADWLEESGQPAFVARAHFIRAQIEAASLPAGVTDRLVCEQKADELLRHYGAGWNATLPEWTTWHDTAFRYHRGFVSELMVTPRRLFRDAHDLAEKAPIDAVQVRTQNAPNHFAFHVRDRAWFSRIRMLWIGPGLALTAPGASDLLNLTVLKHLTGVRRFSLAGNNLDNARVVQFATQIHQLPFLGTLRELDLSGNRITDAAAHTLAAARGLDQLEQLDLRDNRIRTSGVQQLRQRFGERVAV